MNQPNQPLEFFKKIAKADHLPCAITLDIMDELKTPAPKFIYTQKIDDENIAAFREDLISSDLLNLVQHSPNSDPEATYNLISDTLDKLKKKHFPYKKVRFKRHVHKIHPWMTDIILLNIKLKDETYVRYRKAKSPLAKFQLKEQLKVMERDLNDYITQAKAKYYSEQFDSFKDDVKKTWDTIKTAINRRRQKSAYPEFFNVNGNNIFDKTEISNEFNKYFINIGPELADSLDTSGKRAF